jgi:hypothetical protein
MIEIHVTDPEHRSPRVPLGVMMPTPRRPDREQTSRAIDGSSDGQIRPEHQP